MREPGAVPSICLKQVGPEVFCLKNGQKRGNVESKRFSAVSFVDLEGQIFLSIPGGLICPQGWKNRIAPASKHQAPPA